jgi:hypothetical protein
MIRAERNDARRSARTRPPPRCGGAGTCCVPAPSDALAAYIIRKLHNAWNPK